MGLHKGSAPHTAEDGSFAASTSNLPVLQYYPCRGRAEPIRLILSYVRQTWFEPPPMSVRQIVSIMHAEFDGYPFRQLPRFIDEVHGEVDLAQTQAIVRHLGRKYDLYGENMIDAGRIDMLLEGVAELRNKLRAVVVDQQLGDSAVAQYLDTVMALEAQLKKSSMMGPGLASLEYILASQRYSAGGWFVGGVPSIVDFAAFDLVDLHLTHFGDQVRSRFPHLAAHHAKVAALEGIAEYLRSDSRHPDAWPVDWLREHGEGGRDAAA